MTSDGLFFSFKDLQLECEVIQRLARDFLEPTAISVLARAKGELESIQKKMPTGSTSKWSIPLGQPIRTKWSDGESRPNKKGAKIRAELTFVWAVRPLGTPLPKHSHFALDGLASTVVTIFDEHNACLAEWTVETGDGKSPGVHFHSQVKKFGSHPYPTQIDVPRLPALPMTPFLVLEFVLAELFQKRWGLHAMEGTSDVQKWRGIQRPRLERFLNWQLERVSPTSSGSPWVALKLAKPAPGLLLP